MITSLNHLESETTRTRRPQLGDQALAAPPVARVPHARVPRVNHQPVWQGRAAVTAAPAREAALRQAGHLGRLCRLPERRQVVGHQCAAHQEGVQDSASAGRDEGVAVRDADEAHLPHRLPRRGVQQDDGQRDGLCAQGRCARREPGGRDGAHGRGAAACQARVPGAWRGPSGAAYASFHGEGEEGWISERAAPGFSVGKVGNVRGGGVAYGAAKCGNCTRCAGSVPAMPHPDAPRCAHSLSSLRLIFILPPPAPASPPSPSLSSFPTCMHRGHTCMRMLAPPWL
eukprot:363918-Chlamydomonas_euryale.AAC.11